MNKQQFVSTFMDGALSVSDHSKIAESLCGMVWELRRQVTGYKEQIEEMDDIARNHEIRVKCRSCGEYWVPDVELSEITPEGNYCGKSERCCP